MSFNLGMNRIQEALVMALMIILVFALFSSIELAYKISIGVIVFTLIFLVSTTSQIMKQAEEARKQL